MMTTPTSTRTGNLTVLYGFKESVTIDPLASREWFETHADVALYVQRGETPPWGHWTERGYALEWPLEVWLDTADPVWAATAQEDVEEVRGDLERLGEALLPLSPVAPEATEPAIVPVHALYGFAQPTTFELGLMDAAWFDEHADAVIYTLDAADLPIGHFLGTGHASEIVTTQLLAADDARVATARLGIAIYEAEPSSH
jgi:hypothetical protein